MRVVGYLRVSHEESARTGYGLEDQRSRIQAEADRRGWSVMWQTDEAVSGKSLERRGLRKALESLQRKSASALVVAKLDRLSRSVMDFAQLVEQSRVEGWQLVILDLGVDTTTPAGKLIANVFAALAQWEREVIGERTRAALEAARGRGVQLGRPSGVPAAVLSQIQAWRASGWSLRRIAEQLNEQGTPTAQRGRQWWPSTVGALLAAADAA